jgi:hypothetical protein
MAHLVRCQSEQIDDHHAGGNVQEVATVKIGADVPFEPGYAAKPELFRLFRRDDEARAMKSHSAAGKPAVSRQWFCRRKIRTNV